MERAGRRFVAVILTAGLLGTAADLLLLEHYEDPWQLAPLALIALALILLLSMVLRGNRSGRATIVLLRVTMSAFVVAGGAGILLHYDGNAEFQREIDPELSGWPLVVKVMTAKAPPALAPAAMVQLGLIGLLYTFRHPAWAKTGTDAAGAQG